MRILIVDDEPDLCRILQFNLEAAGYDTVVAYTGVEALAVDPVTVDLALLDVMMPGMSGFELARRLRANPAAARLPIIFLTALDTEADVLRGFELGGDDYISKPFSIKEVLARVKAVLHRTAPADSPSKIHLDELEADYASRSVIVQGIDVQLTRTEFDLLWLLINHSGQVYSRQQLISLVWPEGVVVSDRTVDVNITRLRKKIDPYGRCIATRQGYGYYFTADEETH